MFNFLILLLILLIMLELIDVLKITYNKKKLYVTKNSYKVKRKVVCFLQLKIKEKFQWSTSLIGQLKITCFH